MLLCCWLTRSARTEKSPIFNFNQLSAGRCTINGPAWLLIGLMSPTHGFRGLPLSIHLILFRIMSKAYLSELEGWVEKEHHASELINLCNKLMLSSSIELVLFRKPLHNVTSTEVLSHHAYAREVSGLPVCVEDSLMLASAIAAMDFVPSRIDLGRLATEWHQENHQFESVGWFIGRQLAGHLGGGRQHIMPKDVVLFGFGRIGRLLTRLLIAQTGRGEQLRLRAIVLRSCDAESLFKRADLLRYDSVHGPFSGTIVVDAENETLLINGQAVRVIESNNPADVDYTQYGIERALLIDNTGAFRDAKGLGQHLHAPGVDKVLLTAPGQGAIPNIVTGINDELLQDGEGDLFSAASCTTNAIVPVLTVMDQYFGIEKGHIETIHSYTNDQNLLDNYHKKYRRGRSAALNLVITETGAGRAVAKVMPQLAGKLTGNAVRVPTPNVSLAILNLTLGQVVEKDAVNDALRQAALYGPFVEQLDYSISNELVSSDMIGNSHASIVDSPATIVSNDGRSVVLYVWYDNECGYAHQVVRLAKKIAGVVRMTYY